MTRSIHSSHYFFLLFIILAAGCAQQSPTHVSIVEIPANKSSILSKPTRIHSPDSVQTSTAPTKKPIFTNVWERLVSLYALPEIDNERVQQQLQWYLQHPQYIERIQQRAEPYLYFILNEVEAKKIPGELALLPAIESAYKPHAYSSSHAAGLWQFIPSTGRLFGLKQNWWYDGRRDIFASTKAATRYLKELSEDFDHDWLLALASYNAGKGNLNKAIRNNQQRGLKTDYWSLKLRRETMNYVPRLLAISKLVAHPEHYDITLHDIPNKPYFAVVDIESQLDLSKAVEMAQTPSDDFFRLNPGFNRWSTDPDGPHRLLVPVAKAPQFKNQLASLPANERMKWVRHKIKSGENLGQIAKKHQTSISAIKHSNQLKSSLIRAGRYLLIPIAHKSLKSTKNHLGNKTGSIYIVKKGDTFWQIARKFSVRSQDIARWNQLSLNTPLHPGQQLIIKHNLNSAVASGSPMQGS